MRYLAGVPMPSDDEDTLVDMPGVIPEPIDYEISVPRTVTQPIGARAKRVVVRGRSIHVHLNLSGRIV